MVKVEPMDTMVVMVVTQTKVVDGTGVGGTSVSLSNTLIIQTGSTVTSAGGGG